MRYYPAVGPAIPRASVGRSRVTHPFAGHLLRCPRLACVKHAASVRPEPGSNSPREKFETARFRTPCHNQRQPKPSPIPAVASQNHRLLSVKLSLASRHGRQINKSALHVCDLEYQLSNSSVDKTQFGAAFSGSLTTYFGVASKSTGSAGIFRPAASHQPRAPARH